MMNFDKNAMLRKLTYLEMKIDEKEYEALISDRDDIDLDQFKNDLAFVRGLMDDIECGRITEFPLVEKTNLMTGNVYLEDPDTPRSCSPSTELFWSM